MEEFEDVIDYRSISTERKQLERLTSDKYWNEYNGDWKAYLTDVFKHDDIPQPFQKKDLVTPTNQHPFNKWI